MPHAFDTNMPIVLQSYTRLTMGGKNASRKMEQNWMTERTASQKRNLISSRRSPIFTSYRVVLAKQARQTCATMPMLRVGMKEAAEVRCAWQRCRMHQNKLGSF